MRVRAVGHSRIRLTNNVYGYYRSVYDNAFKSDWRPGATSFYTSAEEGVDSGYVSSAFLLVNYLYQYKPDEVSGPYRWVSRMEIRLLNTRRSDHFFLED
jgi:hypothetical protein